MLKAAGRRRRQGHARDLGSSIGSTQEIESAMREAKNAFGDAGLIVEKLL